MYTEDELLPISALQHLLFCERQCALIHLEQLWDENRLTVEGKHLHDRAHEREDESRGDVRIARGLRLRSLRLGLTGMADVVEFRRGPDDAWEPFPVEYKRGKPKFDHCDAVQLCAQALCLEEMLTVSVPTGALFYGAVRRREDVAFDDALRAHTAQAAARLHALITSGQTPPPAYGPKCKQCSLLNLCMPESMQRGKSVARYLARLCASDI
jgi:CRISPR-associated exonuclease Cas4